MSASVAAPAPGLVSARFPAMGTQLEVILPADAPHAALARVRALFDHWERALSRFDPDSELSRLNLRAGTGPVAVGPVLFGVVRSALRAAARTGGAFDPLLGNRLRALGYDRPFADGLDATDAAPDAPVADAPPAGAWRDVRLDPECRTIDLPAGASLDLGGIAKGMAVDASIALLRAAGAASALVSAGGDLAVAGRPPGGAHWPVSIDGAPGLAPVPLERGALATSGTARRRWRRGAVEHHHLLDPRTGLPARSSLRSVSVVAGTCRQAEVAATVAMVLGPLDGPRALARSGLPGLLIHGSGDATAVGGWPCHDGVPTG